MCSGVWYAGEGWGCLVIPNGHVPGTEGNIREWVVDPGLSGHMGIRATKRLLHTRLCFSGMDKMAEETVATESHQRDLLKPNPAPAQPWDRLYCKAAFETNLQRIADRCAFMDNHIYEIYNIQMNSIRMSLNSAFCRACRAYFEAFKVTGGKIVYRLTIVFK